MPRARVDGGQGGEGVGGNLMNPGIEVTSANQGAVAV